MLIGCCHCEPAGSVSSVFASSAESINSSASGSIDTGAGCFCIGSVSANTWRMDIDYGWNSTGANTWCCAIYRKHKSYLLRRVSSLNAVCYWESLDRVGTTPDNDAFTCQFDPDFPRAWMAIHSRVNGITNKYWGNQWAMSAGLLYQPSNLSSLAVLPYVWINPANPPWGYAVDGSPINCLTSYTLNHWTAVIGPNQRRWVTSAGPGGVTQFPCGTGFGTLCNDLAPPTITLTPVAS